MAFEKGKKKTGGRKKGTANKATMQAREAVAEFVEGNADRLTEWLDQIAQDSPKDAFNAFMSVVEYHIPKLSRAEARLIDQDGNDKKFEITVRHEVHNAKDRAE